MPASPEPPLLSFEPGAPGLLAAFCAARSLSPVRVVADRATWEAAGKDAAAALAGAGIEARPSVRGEAEPAADAGSVLWLLSELRGDEAVLVAVGSGTITDIVRFVAGRCRLPFISLPTAPSVDAYTSAVSPLLFEGSKRTLPARPPLAVFADPDILAAAPAPMIAAGFGDTICKFSAVADWRLGALLWEEPYDEDIARRSLAAARSCAAAAEAIGAGDRAGLLALARSLMESGTCMAAAGHSRPASGAEHQYSHFWEMRLRAEGRGPILHGLKVGAATVIAARLWDRVKALSPAEARELLVASLPPGREAEISLVHRTWGIHAEEMLGCQGRFLALQGEAWRAFAARVASSWDRILEFAAEVPGAGETERLLGLAGCPADPRRLGLGEREIALAHEGAHFMRDRFTVRKLARMLAGD
jgi:glycerol-1-phosphate dehydrogenase [NAD(P)+]